MTITEAEIRSALERAVDQAALASEVHPGAGQDGPVVHLARRRRWPRVAVAAAAVAAIAGMAVFAADDSQRVRTEPGAPTTRAGERSTSSTAAAVTGSIAPAPAELRVLVLNGSGDSAQASVLTAQLAEAGYQTQPAQNANDTVDPTRVYFAAGHEIAAHDLAARLGRSEFLPLPVQPLGTGETSESAVADLVVVVGRDWSPGPLKAPAADATYQTTTTSPAQELDPRGVLWAGTAADAAPRSTPEGTIRELLSHVEPRPTVDDITVTASRTAGWQVVTARVDGRVYVTAEVVPGADGWLVLRLGDADNVGTATSARRYPDGTLLVGAPVGTESVEAYDLDQSPPRAARFEAAGPPAPIETGDDPPLTGFRLNGPSGEAAHGYLVVGRDAAGAVTTVHAIKI